MNLRLLTVAALVSSLHLVSAADITGKITLKGNPPQGPQLTFDPGCGALHKAPKFMPFYVVAKDGGLADVFVSLKGQSGKSTGDKEKPLLIDQVGCEYTPYVSAVQTKQPITVRNSDPMMHNVHPMPAVEGNPESNKAQMPKGPEYTYAFSKPETFLKFKCDVHGWMFAYVSVVDHPYFAVSGADGSYTIKNVPPGKYTLVVNHRKAGVVEKEIEVKDSVKADFTMEVPAPK